MPEECSAALLNGSSRSPSAYPVLCLKADTSSSLKHLFFPQLLLMATFLSLVVTKVASHCTAAQCSLTPVHGLPKSRDGGTDRASHVRREGPLLSNSLPGIELPRLPPSPLWDPHRSLQSALSIVFNLTSP